MITVPDGGYDLEKVTDTQTEVTIQNTFEGYGFGKLIVGFATTAAVKDAPALTERINSAVKPATAAVHRSRRASRSTMPTSVITSSRRAQAAVRKDPITRLQSPQRDPGLLLRA